MHLKVSCFAFNPGSTLHHLLILCVMWSRHLVLLSGLNLDPQVPVDAIVVKCVLAHLRQCNSAIPHATPSLDSFEQCGIVIAYATIKQLPQRVGQLEAHMAAIKESAITLSILVKKLKMQNNNATNMSSRSDK